MLPSVEEKLQANTSFKKLVTSSLTRAMKIKSDDLTIGEGLKNKADALLLDYIRSKVSNGSILNHQVGTLQANDMYVAAILSMFDDSDEDNIVAKEDAQGALVIDWDLSKPIVITKIEENSYLYMLAGATPEDFSRIIFYKGAWYTQAEYDEVIANESIPDEPIEPTV